MSAAASFASALVQVAEGESLALPFTFNENAQASCSVMVAIDAGDATAGNDYTDLEGELFFFSTEDDRTQNVLFTALADGEDNEGVERVLVTLQVGNSETCGASLSSTIAVDIVPPTSSPLPNINNSNVVVPPSLRKQRPFVSRASHGLPQAMACLSPLTSDTLAMDSPVGIPSTARTTVFATTVLLNNRDDNNAVVDDNDFVAFTATLLSATSESSRTFKVNAVVASLADAPNGVRLVLIDEDEEEEDVADCFFAWNTVHTLAIVFDSAGDKVQLRVGGLAVAELPYANFRASPGTAGDVTLGFGPAIDGLSLAVEDIGVLNDDLPLAAFDSALAKFIMSKNIRNSPWNAEFYNDVVNFDMDLEGVISSDRPFSFEGPSLTAEVDGYMIDLSDSPHRISTAHALPWFATVSKAQSLSPTDCDAVAGLSFAAGPDFMPFPHRTDCAAREDCGNGFVSDLEQCDAEGDESDISCNAQCRFNPVGDLVQSDFYDGVGINARLGSTMDIIQNPDVDGDNIPDIITSEYNQDNVVIIRMAADGSFGSESTFGTSDFPGSEASDDLGRAVASMGIIGGKQMVAVSAMNTQTVYLAEVTFDEIVSLGQIAVLQPEVTPNFADTGHSATFGSSLANVGDINGDGVTDLAIGDVANADCETENCGAVYVVFLAADYGVQSFSVISESTNGFSHTLGNWDFGAAISRWGTVGDRTVLLIGAPVMNSSDGGVFNVLIDQDGEVVRSTLIDGATLASPYPHAKFGAAISNAADLDFDGVPDVIIGAPSATVLEDKEGSIFLVHMNAAGLPKGSALPIQPRYPQTDIGSVPEGHQFGTSIALVKFDSGASVPDLVVGADAYFESATSAGTLYSFSMRAYKCGDGQVASWEECDDGNGDNGDGCTSECIVEVDDDYTCDDAEPSFCESIG